MYINSTMGIKESDVAKYFSIFYEVLKICYGNRTQLVYHLRIQLAIHEKYVVSCVTCKK